jgi:hypothetical protein
VHCLLPSCCQQLATTGIIFVAPHLLLVTKFLRSVREKVMGKTVCFAHKQQLVYAAQFFIINIGVLEQEFHL